MHYVPTRDQVAEVLIKVVSSSVWRISRRHLSHKVKRLDEWLVKQLVATLTN